MNGFNRVILKGTTGQDPDVKTVTINNVAYTVATVSIAINDSYTDKASGERKTKTEWVRIEAWKGLAEFLGKSVKKGTDILVEGRLKTDSWEQDGQTKYSTKVVAEQILFTQSMKTSGNGTPNQNNGAQNGAQKNTVPQQNSAPTPVMNQQTAVQQTQQYVTNDQFNSGMPDDDLPF